MRKKQLIFTSLSIMLVMVLAVSAGTFALFTDTAKNENNQFTAGTVLIRADRTHGDPLQGPMFYPNWLDPEAYHPYDQEDQFPSNESPGGWAPGDTVSRSINIKNLGSLEVKLTGVNATVKDFFTLEGRTAYGITSGDAYQEFIEKAIVEIKVDGGMLLYDGPLKDLIHDDSSFTPVRNKVKIAAKKPNSDPSSQAISFKVHLDKSASNELRNQTFIFEFGIKAEQSRNN